ncbi:hypothetical protein HWV62_43062, partial [Athelia sp. TMB]
PSTGVIASIRKRARSFSSQKEKPGPIERNASTPNTAVHAHSNPPTPPPASGSAATVTAGPDTPPVLSPAQSRSQSHSRARSRSPPHRGRYTTASPPPLDDLELLQPSVTGWWERTNDAEAAHRPWRDALADALGMSPPLNGDKKLHADRKATLGPQSPAQEEGYTLTRQRVERAAKEVLGTALAITHEGLLVSVDALEFVPVPGLQAAARTLLGIWDALQRVDMNRMACLRLTQRCADILLSVRQEVQDAGGDVSAELQEPVDKLVASFQQVEHFLQKQTDRPFLKRYLRRDEILKQLAGCDSSLSDSVTAFSISIQIRILKQVQALHSSMIAGGALPPGYSSPTMGTSALPPITPSPPTPQPPGGYLSTHEPDAGGRTPRPSHTHLTPDDNDVDVLARLHAVRAQQNRTDAELDYADLRRLLRAALQAGSDAQMIGVLQVGRDEMPEAIKTLQRALEREVEKESSASGSGSEGAGRVVGLGLEFEERRASAPEERADKGKGKDAGLERRRTVATQGSTGTASSGGMTASGSAGSAELRARDTLDREFIESGIDALRRVSGGDAPKSLPAWTITKYEIDLDETALGKIGIGYFSSVYKGTWRRKTVAIKVLAKTTPRALFTHEIEIWKDLSHANVLALYGASSAAGEPPWFFVSPYCANGSLVAWLAARRRAGQEAEVDLLRCMHQVAKGMEYLHRRGVLHGDLKGANVLVDDKRRCLVSDFGQSEMRSEAYRLSGTPPPHGTLRWQAPEMLDGVHNNLTPQIDVYAFAICCVEILDMGGMPWKHHDDNAVIRFVSENKRPSLPHTRITSPALVALIDMCWARDPQHRPPFKKIALDLKQLRMTAGSHIETESPAPRHNELFPENEHASPDLAPIPLPGTTTVVKNFPLIGSPATDTTFETAMEGGPGTPSRAGSQASEEGTREPMPVIYTPSRASSMFESAASTSSASTVEIFPRHDGYDSPPPLDDRLKSMRDERRYRMLLQHEFHPSLVLPLWTPSVVTLGDVGYLDKPSGQFIVLCNALAPQNTQRPGIARLPPMSTYGLLQHGEQRSEKRNVALRGLDALSGFLTFRSSARQSVSRRISMPLREGHKAAYLCTESTKYRYMAEMAAPKKWFTANVDAVMREFGAEHRVQREDLHLIIGTLEAENFALFVSHQHPDGQVHFNVFSNPRNGQNWGVFTADTELPADLAGPSYPEEIPGTSMSANKVSLVGRGDRWSTVLVARLRFKPDATEPTSLL